MKNGDRFLYLSFCLLWHNYLGLSRDLSHFFKALWYRNLNDNGPCENGMSTAFSTISGSGNPLANRTYAHVSGNILFACNSSVLSGVTLRHRYVSKRFLYTVHLFVFTFRPGHATLQVGSAQHFAHPSHRSSNSCGLRACKGLLMILVLTSASIAILVAKTAYPKDCAHR
jgi:hypothetical protein